MLPEAVQLDVVLTVMSELAETAQLAEKGEITAVSTVWVSVALA